MSEPDWGQLRERVRRYLKAHAREFNLSDADVDDLCGEAVLAVVRYSRSHTIDNPEALLITCAQRAAKDLAASRRRWRIIDEPLDSNSTASASTSSAEMTLGDPVSRVRTIAILFFKTYEQGCVTLAHAYFAERPWAELAASLGMVTATVRQRWLRCLEKFRAAIIADKRLARLLDLDDDEDSP